MKTVEKKPVDIDDLPPTPKAIDSICFVCGVTSQELEDAIVSLVKRHEKEIRADERDNCVDLVLQIDGIAAEPGSEFKTLIRRGDATAAIMNTVAI